MRLPVQPPTPPSPLRHPHTLPLLPNMSVHLLGFSLSLSSSSSPSLHRNPSLCLVSPGTFECVGPFRKLCAVFQLCLLSVSFFIFSICMALYLCAALLAWHVCFHVNLKSNFQHGPVSPQFNVTFTVTQKINTHQSLKDRESHLKTISPLLAFPESSKTLLNIWMKKYFIFSSSKFRFLYPVQVAADDTNIYI